VVLAGSAPKVLRNLKIREVSSVDRGAGKGVKVVFMKRDQGGTTLDTLITVVAELRKGVAGVRVELLHGGLPQPFVVGVTTRSLALRRATTPPIPHGGGFKMLLMSLDVGHAFADRRGNPFKVVFAVRGQSSVS
jgi:hypothetical protein